MLSHPGDVLQLVQADLKPPVETQNTAEFNTQGCQPAPNLWFVRIGAWLVSTPGMVGSLRQRSGNGAGKQPSFNAPIAKSAALPFL